MDDNSLARRIVREAPGVDYFIAFLLGMAAVWLWPRLRQYFRQSPEQGRTSATPVPLIAVPADADPSPSTSD